MRNTPQPVHVPVKPALTPKEETPTTVLAIARLSNVIGALTESLGYLDKCTQLARIAEPGIVQSNIPEVPSAYNGCQIAGDIDGQAERVEELLHLVQRMNRELDI